MLDDRMLLSARAVSKRFPGVVALDGVDFDVRPGEIHALLGQNGAGKSTLVKVLTGVMRRDGGEMRLLGRPYDPPTPAAAQRAGIHTVYQELNLVPTLSIAENLFLGRFPRGPLGIRWGEVRRRAAALLAEFDLRLDPARKLGDCPAAVQQLVAIARAVDCDARVLVLDEPTASLDRHEVDLLFERMRRLRGRGIGIIFITHFLDEVYRISDRLTVLRNGRLVGSFATGDLSRVELVEHLLGTAVEEGTETRRHEGTKGTAGVSPANRGTGSAGVSPANRGTGSAGVSPASPGTAGFADRGPNDGPSHLPTFPPSHAAPDRGPNDGPSHVPTFPPSHAAPHAAAAEILSARGLSRRGAIAAFDLSMRKGEIVGLAGLLGSGRTELARLLFGADRADSGFVRVAGRRLANGNPRASIAAGVAFCPEERRRDGIIPDMSVRDNIALVVQRRLSRLGFVSHGLHARVADAFVRALDIRTPDLDRPVRLLSGGNQQKVILARWLASRPLVLILDEPTRGIDIGAKAEVEALVRRVAGEGVAVLLISSELEEVARVSARVLVLRERRVVQELSGEDVRLDRIMREIAEPGRAGAN